jgi:hypothetical protein
MEKQNFVVAIFLNNNVLICYNMIIKKDYFGDLFLEFFVFVLDFLY